MSVTITKPFRIREADGQRAYEPGDTASGNTAEWALRNGFGEKAAPATENKMAKQPRNKAAK